MGLKCLISCSAQFRDQSLKEIIDNSALEVKHTRYIFTFQELTLDFPLDFAVKAINALTEAAGLVFPNIFFPNTL